MGVLGSLIFPGDSFKEDFSSFIDDTLGRGLHSSDDWVVVEIKIGRWECDHVTSLPTRGSLQLLQCIALGM